MRRSLLIVLALFTASMTGCAALTPQPAPPSGSSAGGNAFAVPKESQDLVRKGELDAYARADDAEDEQLDRLEKDALLAVRISLGKDKWAEGMPAPAPAAQSIAALRKLKVKMKLQPAANAPAGTQDDFLQLKDEATDRMGVLGRKSADGTATAAERREMMAYAKYAQKLMDLKMQVNKLTFAALTVNSHVQTSSMSTMLRVSGLVRSRKLYGMEMNAEDYGLVRRGLERQRRAEAIAATTMAMVGAYQAAINNGGDPKALEMIGNATLEAFPLKPAVDEADAKAYVTALGDNVQKVKARYEGQMRKTWGDAKYDKTYKPAIDAMFARAEGASSQKSVTQIAADANSKYKTDVGKCMRGEVVDPGSMVGGGQCKSLRQAALTGDTSDLLPGALQAFRSNGGASNAAGATGPLPRNAKNALDAAAAAASGDAGGALDGVARIFPADGTIGASLQGLSALKNGDPRGAINAALSFVPIPGLKDIFGLASKLLFKS